MNVVCGIGRLSRPLKASVAAIGVFDGVHRGHGFVLRHLVASARRKKVPSVVVTFDPHPVEVLHPERFKGYILPLSERLRLIAEAGVDVCVVINFTKKFSITEPEQFVRRVLCQKLGVIKIVVGDDFHFGHDRAGSISLLAALGQKYHFSVEADHILKIKDINIKSKNIRAYISSGNLDGAARLLGRPVAVSGEVVHGDRRGRRLGFPTANISRENVIIPPSGIYLARVLFCHKKINALFYIGKRPSFKKAQADVSLEAYLLDFKGSLYGKKVSVECIKKIRDDIRFSDGESLAAQIRKDVICARRYFRSCC